jgi:hypothetical protein
MDRAAKEDTHEDNGIDWGTDLGEAGPMDRAATEDTHEDSDCWEMAGTTDGAAKEDTHEEGSCCRETTRSSTGDQQLHGEP